MQLEFYDGGVFDPQYFGPIGAQVGPDYAVTAATTLLSARFSCPRPSTAFPAGTPQPWRAVVQAQPAGTTSAADAIDVATLDIDLAAAPIDVQVPTPPVALAVGDVLRCGIVPVGTPVPLDAPDFLVALADVAATAPTTPTTPTTPEADMAAKILKEGQVQLLADLLSAGENWQLRLFSTSRTPAVTDVLANYTAIEANFTGYAPITLTRSVSGATWSTPAATGTTIDAINSNAKSTYGAAAQSWSASSAQTIYGYFLSGVTSGKGILAELFSSPISLTNPSSLSMSPTMEFGSF